MANLAEIKPFTRLIHESDCETVDVLGPSIQFLVEPQANDEAPCVVKGTIPPGVAVPIHRHPAIEFFYVLSGNIEVLSEEEGKTQWIVAGPGDFIEVPSGAKHGFRNRSQQPVVQLITTNIKAWTFFSRDRQVRAAGRKRESACSRATAGLRLDQRTLRLLASKSGRECGSGYLTFSNRDLSSKRAFQVTQERLAVA